MMGSYFSKQLNLKTTCNDITSKCDNIKNELNELKRLLMEKAVVKALIDNNIKDHVSTDEFYVLVKKLTDEALIIYDLKYGKIKIK